VILYLDTSALVKLYVDEDGSDIVRRCIEQASVVSTSKIAFVEARSAFARAKREKIIKSAVYQQIVDRLHYDWKRYMIVEISDGLVVAAGELVEEFSLRGFDAIHLASALFLQQQTGHTVLAACWDARLWEALKKAGLEIVPEKRPGNLI
jgi:predicted nucleic acid-binding protein